MAKDSKRKNRAEPDEYLAVMLQHTALLTQVAEKRNVVAIRKTYQREVRDFVAQLHKVHRQTRRVTSDNKPISGYEAQVAIAQVRRLIPQMSVALLKTLNASVREAQIAGLRTVIASVEKLERDLAKNTVALTVQQPAMFSSILEQRLPTIERSAIEALQNYGQQTAEEVQRQLSLAIALDETFDETMIRVEDVLIGAQWKADRIARTEAAFGFNAALYDGVSSMSRQFPDVENRWTELVYDSSGEPMDARVAVDSLALHGQIAGANGIFVMPPDPRVRPTMWGETYRFPPNRPNDRAVLVPWKPTWGVPGYRYVNGKAVGVAKDGSLTGPLPPNLNASILPLGSK